MKKVLIAASVMMGFVSLNVIGKQTDLFEANEKIVFEGYELTTCSSKENVEDEVLKNKNQIVNVQLKLDYETLPTIDRMNISEHDNISKIKLENKLKNKKYYSQMNNELFKEMNLDGYDDCYISKFAPYIDFEYSKESFVDNFDNIVGEIQENESIACAYVQKIEYGECEGDEITDENELYNSIENSWDALNITDIIENQTYTGSGVKVGVLDPEGLVNFTSPGIVLSNLTLWSQPGHFELSEHATMVSSIMCGPDGIAPDASLYSARLLNSPTNEMDMFLENDVDIVNMSFSSGDGGDQNSFSIYMDFIAYAYGLTIVASAGNYGKESRTIGVPAVGWNVIAVGATDQYGTEVADYSPSGCKTYVPHKPNVVAPGEYYLPAFDKTVAGTSYAAPAITGFIALMMQKNTALKISSDEVAALLAAGSKDLAVEETKRLSGYNYYSGAGMPDFAAVARAYQYTYMVAVSGNDLGVKDSLHVTLATGKTDLRFAISWHCQVIDTNATNVDAADFDIAIYKDDVRVGFAYSSISNNELIRYEGGTGKVRFEIQQLVSRPVSHRNDIIYVSIFRGL